MDSLPDLLTQVTAFARTHLATISTAFTLVLLVVFGDNVNRFVKKAVRTRPFLVRTLVFILLCTFGYGMLAVWMTPLISKAFLYFGDRYLAPVIVAAFIGLGMLAERKQYL